MPINLAGIDNLSQDAVAHYWNTLTAQSTRQREGEADRGRRAAVTGGRQMDGFCRLIQHVLVNNGIQNSDIFLNSELELPGFFRPTKKWDILVVHDGTLLAAMECKSQRGPSFGNNFNNRAEEAIGTAHDLWTAYREGALGDSHPRPWTGWIMLLESCPQSTSPVVVKEPHFPVLDEFRGSSYAMRYELLLRKLMRERLYDAAAFMTANEEDGLNGEFQEPADDLTIRSFLAGLGGHVETYLASRQD
ncbi:MAG: PaeR7I family type II restriction endonuclease [Patescibacteria group bacterium]